MKSAFLRSDRIYELQPSVARADFSLTSDSRSEYLGHNLTVYGLNTLPIQVRRMNNNHSVSKAGRRRLRRAIRKPYAAFKGLTGVLPDVLMIGMPRSGTSMMSSCLIQHPNFFAPSRKEIEFFNTPNWNAGVRWYRSHFPSVFQKFYQTRIKNAPFFSGEATVTYLSYSLSLARVSEVLPNAKFIVMLRNPTDRAYSWYQFRAADARYKATHSSFEDAIAKEEGILQQEQKTSSFDDFYRRFLNRGPDYYPYLAESMYVHQLKVWMDAFPKERFLFIKSEAFYADMAAQYRRVTDFLGLAPWELDTYERPPSSVYPPIRAETRRRLVEFFGPHNEQLYEFLGVNFGWEL